jgi:hypothetical protein
MRHSAFRTVCSVILFSKAFILTDTVHAGKILRVDLDGTNPVVVVPNQPELRGEIDFDLAARKLYWMSPEGIFTAKLDGSRAQKLLPVGQLATLVKDDMIVTPDFIFWTENGSIFRAKLDGSQKRQIFRASSLSGAASNLAYDNVTSRLYWDGRSDPSTQDSGHGIVRSMNLDGSKRRNLIEAR